MDKHWFEALIGFIIVVICITFSYRVYKVSGGGYSVKQASIMISRFNNVDGVTVGTDVKLGGVKVGAVKSVTLDDDLMVIVEILVDCKTKIPVDSSLSVVSGSLLGGKYLEIKPGFEENFIKNGGSFKRTNSAINIEGIISRFAFK